MAQFDIRVFGDPVLRTPTAPVTDIDGALKQLVDDMLETMYAAPGVGLAAPQVGVQKRFFVYDVGDGPGVVINPEIKETSGEWVHDEGCLSVPGLFWPITRPKLVHLVGLDIDGNDIEFEADELMARMLQHEVDHLDGTLLLARLDGDQRREAMRTLRSRTLDLPAS
jgi:peptide deformylase